MADLREIDTPVGLAQVALDRATESRGLLMLGHGAGGGIESPDLLAVTAVAREHGLSVARVLQPYRVAGRRAAAPAAQLDTAWLAVADALERSHPGEPLIVGGRSSGARVACRTASQLDAAAVLCLAFPLHPPGHPEKSRLAELESVPAEVPVLVIQGERDPFGRPPHGPGRQVLTIPGTHALRAAGPVRTAAGPWLAAVAGPTSRT